MKQFLAFAGSEYYPAGGWEDFVGSFDAAQEAATAAAAAAETLGSSKKFRWWHVVDLTTGEQVASG